MYHLQILFRDVSCILNYMQNEHMLMGGCNIGARTFWSGTPYKNQLYGTSLLVFLKITTSESPN